MTVLQGGRAKAYRPLAEGLREAALAEYLAACRSGAWFEAHELLEPAWMGTTDSGERNLYQGLIKIAAAHVHRERGNPLGIQKNLAGARERLSDALAGGADERGFDIRGLMAQIDDRLERLAAPGARAEDIPLVEIELTGREEPQNQP
jgi:predicted metal-dependent hydrolase